MSMQKLRGIRNMGAYTAQRSMLEHLLRLEEIILQETPESINIPNERERIEQQLKEYKEQNQINKAFEIEDIQQYLLTTTEREMSEEKSKIRGTYTSKLVEQAGGDEPITIDMLGNNINHLLLAINTPRHIIINNAKGNYTGAGAGSNDGKAQITINNTKGNYTGAFAGSDHGTAHLTINNTNGDFTGAIAGRYRGKAYLTLEKTKGMFTGAGAGINNGRAIIVAYNNEGKEQFFNHQGTIVSYNQNETPRIEGIAEKKRKRILNLIKQNAPPEKIMEYLVKRK